MVNEKFIPRAYAAYSVEGDIRKESSSGGVFSLLCEDVLGRGGAVFGAAFGEGGIVSHVCVRDVSSLSRLRGAKYSRSSLGDCFSQVKALLASGVPVLFSGTPCQCGALSSYLGSGRDGLILVDFICHGVPLPSVWEAYLKWRSREDGKEMLPSRINLRSKDTGWSRYSYSLKFEYPDGDVTLSPSSSDAFMRGFVRDYYLAESCYSCRFKGDARASDITLGDFWGIWSSHPEMDDNGGTSAVVVNTALGAELWERVGSRACILPVTLDEVTAENPSYLRSASRPEMRDGIVRCINSENFGSVVEDAVRRDDARRRASDGGSIKRVLRYIKRKLR